MRTSTIFSKDSIRNCIILKFFNFRLFTILSLFILLPHLASAAITNKSQYWGGSGAWDPAITTYGWSADGSTGSPYTFAWTGNGTTVSTTAYFNIPNSTVSGPTSANLYVGGIEATENVTVTKSSTKTIGCFGATAGVTTLIPINVAAGKVFDLGDQTITPSNLNGITKNGPGELSLIGNPYVGGFTLNAGQVTMKGLNALCKGPLIINGGTIATTASFVTQHTSITIGGDFTLGAESSLAPVGTGTTGMSGFSITFPAVPTSLGSATRTITLGGKGPYTFSGVISGAAGTGLILTGCAGGTLNLSGANTYDGGTTISGDTLLLGANEVLANAGTMTLNGGTLKTTTACSETMGTLSLTDNSTIALTTGTNTLTFANSSSISWTSGKTLTITGWTGTAGTSGTAGQIFVGNDATGLTAGQLAQITFAGYTNGTQILSTGELVPNAGTTTGIHTDSSKGVSVSVQNGVILINGLTAASSIKIYNANGKMIKSAIVNNNASFDVTNGIYLVKVGTKVFKVVK